MMHSHQPACSTGGWAQRLLTTVEIDGGWQQSSPAASRDHASRPSLKVRRPAADVPLERRTYNHVVHLIEQSDAGPVTLEEARRRLRELRASWEYAFAMGHGCSMGPDPHFDAVRREVADLRAIIAEHEPTGSELARAGYIRSMLRLTGLPAARRFPDATLLRHEDRFELRFDGMGETTTIEIPLFTLEGEDLEAAQLRLLAALQQRGYRASLRR